MPFRKPETDTARQVIGGVAFALYVKLFASGMGRHIYCLSRYQISQVAKWTLLSQIFISINLGLTKISICALVLRVIDRSHKRFSQFIWALIIFVTVTHIAQLILFLTQCRPVEANWNPSVGGNCFSERITYSVAYLNFSKLLLKGSLVTINLFYPGLDCFSDLACAAIPIYVIQRLQLKRRIKIALCFLMSLGVL